MLTALMIITYAVAAVVLCVMLTAISMAFVGTKVVGGLITRAGGFLVTDGLRTGGSRRKPWEPLRAGARSVERCCTCSGREGVCNGKLYH